MKDPKNFINYIMKWWAMEEIIKKELKICLIKKEKLEILFI